MEEERLISIKDLSPYIEIDTIGITSVSGRILLPIEQNIIELKKYFTELGYIPYFDKSGIKASPHIIRFTTINRDQPVKRAKNYPIILNIILFVATVMTTLLVGALNRGGNPFVHFKDIVLGVPFSFSLILILTGHELGHYFTSRHYGVKVTLPYFLPIPHPLIGTMGAFIKIKSILPNRRALVRIGAAGPIIGFILAIPIIIIGITSSKIANISNVEGSFRLGSSLLFQLITYIVHPKIPAGYDLVLHPMAFAGWLGFFVTALNLIPIGQLDGGHIAYAVMGKYRKPLSIILIVGMAALGLVWPGWFFWVLLIMIFGLRHPKAQDEITQLRASDKIIAGIALVIFILAFMPNPFPIKL